MADSFFAKLRTLAGLIAADGRPLAADVTIADAGTHFTGTTVEAALQELGVGGAPGEGVPTGGSTGQVLAKASATDYDTEWITSAGGGGGLVEDVTTHGATGDGTTDDTAAVQAAQVAAGVGGLVYFPAGTYSLKGTIDCDLAGQIFTGPGIVTFDPGGVRTDSVIELFRVSAPRVRFESLTFDGLDLASYSIATPPHDWFIVFDEGGGGDHGRVHGCTFRRQSLPSGHFAAAIGVLGQTTTTGVIVSGCTFLGLGGGGVFFQAMNCSAIGNYFEDCNDAPITFNSINARGCTAVGNVIIAADPYPAVIVEEGAYDWTITGNVIRDCSRALVVSHASYSGAALGGGIFANNMIVDLIENGLGATATVGVHITSAKYKNIHIRGNQFLGIDPVAAEPGFVVVEANTEGFTIEDNLFEGKAQAVHGVVFGSGSHTRFAFRRNTVRSNSTGTKLTTGLWLQSFTFTNGDISDNLFENIANQAVKVDGAGWVGRMSNNRFLTVGAAYGPAGPIVVTTPNYPHWYDNSTNGYDLEMPISASAAIEVSDEGSSLTATVAEFDFVGAGVTVTEAGDVVTVTIPGGGGGGSGHPLDTPPGSPHASDDDFPGPALDGQWTDPLTSAAGQTNDITFNTDGWLSLKPDMANVHVFGVSQAAPAGDFSVAAKFLELGGGNDVRSGIFVGIDGGQGHVLGPFLQDAQVGAIGVTTISSTADWSGYDGYLLGMGGTWPVVTWVRIRWDSGASTLYWDWSQNGVVWINGGSRGSQSQPDLLGFCIYSNSGAIQTAEEIMLDWFRVEE